MTKMKLLSAGVLSIAMLATPALAQVEVTQESGLMGFSYPNTAYVRGGYGHRFTPGPGYYYGGAYRPAPRVGAFATAPWDDGSSGYGGYYGYVAPY